MKAPNTGIENFLLVDQQSWRKGGFRYARRVGYRQRNISIGEFKLPSFKPAVTALFDRASSMLNSGGQPATPNSHPFLNTLREDALANRANWQERLDVYIQCLEDQGALTTAEVYELLALASECPTPSIPDWAIWSPALWIVIGAFSVLGWSTYSLGPVQLVFFTLAVVFGGGYAGWLMFPRPSRQPHRPSHVGAPLLMAVAMAALAIVFSSLLPAIIKEAYLQAIIHRHAKDVKRFATDPEGFPELKKFAKENYGLNIVLNDPDNNWTDTALALPGASPASIFTIGGYSVLNIDTRSLESGFAIADSDLRKHWMRLVLIHEMAHSVDGVEDARSLNGDGSAIMTHAIAPKHSKSVTDIYTYIEAARKPDSKLWREAYADVFAIGYMRITEPTYAPALIRNLRAKRTENKEDAIHQTSCFIDIARQSAPPQSLATLPAWTDKIRSTASCRGIEDAAAHK